MARRCRTAGDVRSLNARGWWSCPGDGSYTRAGRPTMLHRAANQVPSKTASGASGRASDVPPAVMSPPHAAVSTDRADAAGCARRLGATLHSRPPGRARQ